MNSFGIFNFLSHFLFELFGSCDFGDFILNHRFQVTGVFSFEKALAFAYFARLRSFFVNFCTIAFIALDHLNIWFWNSWRFRLHAANISRVNFIFSKNFVFFFLLNHIWPFQNGSLGGESSDRRSKVVWNTRETLIKHICESLICRLVAMSQN